MNLRAAAERVLAATPEERNALLVDLRHEHAESVYRIEHARARIAVLEVLELALRKAERA